MNNEEIIIYNWLQNARFENRKAKDVFRKDKFKKYSDKYEIILKSVMKINEIKSNNIKYRWDEKIKGLCCIHFYFIGDVPTKSVSFHLPDVYAELIKKETKWNLK